MRKPAVIVCLLLLSALGNAQELDWHPIQTYSMISLEPEKAWEKGLTVNGLWAGFGMAEAVRGTTFVTSAENDFPVEYSYATMKDYVDACHEAGVLAPATLMGTAGYTPLRARFPELETGACVGADGERAYWNPPTGYFMCAINPVYGEVLATLGKEALDAGVDLIVIDEIQGNETAFYWSNEPGFCEHCLAAYRKHLSENFSSEELTAKFEIDDLSAFDFAARLGGQRALPWLETDPLFRELWRLQERLNFENKRTLVDALRAHMDAIDYHVPICANVPNVGSTWGGGHRLPGLKWSQLLDFLAMENGEQEMGFPPREKWLADERLAAAAFRYPSCTAMVYPPVHAAETEGRYSILMQVLFYESIANQSSYVNYFQPRFFAETEIFWTPTMNAQKFIRTHRDLLAPKSTVPANVAILYVENEGQRFQTNAYQGVAQALSESQIPFGIVTDGGDALLAANLNAAALEPYDVLVLPNALFLVEQQKQALEGYMEQGGTVLMSPAPGHEAEMWSSEHDNAIPLPVVDANGTEMDLASAYFQTYDDAQREQLASLVREHADNMLEVDGLDRTACVFPYIQDAEQRVVLHLVNYDYDKEANVMRPKTDITIRLKQPEFMTAAREGKLYSLDLPDAVDGQAISCELADGYLVVQVPELKNYSLIVL